jgi:hypothetical protein
VGKNCQIFNITKLGGAGRGETMKPSCDEYLKKKEEEAISFQFVGADLFPHLWCSIVMWRMSTLLNQLIVSVS